MAKSDKTFLLIISTLICSMAFEQKGINAEKPWVEELTYQHLTTAIHNDSSKSPRFKYYNVFGKWEFTVTGPSFIKVNENRTEGKIKAIPFLLGWPNDVYSKTSRANILDLNAIDDEKNKYTGRYYLRDSIVEEFTERFLKQDESYRIHFFQKRAEGFIRNSAGDSVAFALGVDYDNPGQDLNTGSFIEFPGKRIRIIPLFVEEAKRNPIRGLYGGFQFLDKEKVIAEARFGKGFAGSLSHRFWMSDALSKGERQVIGALLFIIVYFY